MTDAICIIAKIIIIHHINHRKLSFSFVFCDGGLVRMLHRSGSLVFPS